jgi:hypothetical protein
MAIISCDLLGPYHQSSLQNLLWFFIIVFVGAGEFGGHGDGGFLLGG